MRETILLAIAALAALLGMALGRLLTPKRVAPAVTAATTPVPPITVAPAPAVTTIAPLPSPPEPVDANFTAEAIHAWRRQDKDEIVQRIESLSKSEAEHLCFVLQLIPRDEVFDEINVKRRLRRHVDDMRMAEQFAEIDTAFHELERDR